MAKQMWDDPDGLTGLMEWVDGVMAPESFVTVVRVCNTFCGAVWCVVHCRIMLCGVTQDVVWCGER